MKFILDRIEKNIAVCFDFETESHQYNFHLADFSNINEGDIFTAEINSEKKVYNIDILKDETTARKAFLRKRLDSLFTEKK